MADTVHSAQSMQNLASVSTRNEAFNISQRDLVSIIVNVSSFRRYCMHAHVWHEKEVRPHSLLITKLGPELFIGAVYPAWSERGFRVFTMHARPCALRLACLDLWKSTSCLRSSPGRKTKQRGCFNSRKESCGSRGNDRVQRQVHTAWCFESKERFANTPCSSNILCERTF